MSKTPIFQKRHFEYIADCIKETIYKPAHPEYREELLVKNLANKLGKTNPKFNAEMFIERCGVVKND